MIDNKTIVRNTLTAETLSINIQLIKQIGHLNAILLSALIAKDKRVERLREYINVDWFYFPQEEIHQYCFLIPAQQTYFLKQLLDLNLVQKKKMGMPATNFYRINYDEITKIIFKENPQKEEGVDGVTSSEILKDKCLRFTELNNIYNNILSPLNINDKPFIFNRRLDGSDSRPVTNLIPEDSDGREKEEEIDPTSVQAHFHPPKTKLHRRNTEGKSTLFISASMGTQKAAEKKAARLKEEEKNRKKHVPLKRVPPEIEYLLTQWQNYGLNHLPDKEKAPASYNAMVSNLRKVLVGALIPGEERRFEVADVDMAMAKFSLMALDNDYWPTGEMKSYFKTLPLTSFIYNPYGKSKIKSWFIQCHDTPPLEKLKEEHSEEDVPNLHPAVTKRIESFFCKYVLGGLAKKNFTPKEENKFRLAANKICELYDRRMSQIVGINGHDEMADVLCAAIKHLYGNETTKVWPGSFCSSTAMKQLIAYMNEKGYIPGADFELNF